MRVATAAVLARVLLSRGRAGHAVTTDLAEEEPGERILRAVLAALAAPPARVLRLCPGKHGRFDERLVLIGAEHPLLPRLLDVAPCLTSRPRGRRAVRHPCDLSGAAPPQDEVACVDRVAEHHRDRATPPTTPGRRGDAVVVELAGDRGLPRALEVALEDPLYDRDLGRVAGDEADRAGCDRALDRGARERLLGAVAPGDPLRVSIRDSPAGRRLARLEPPHDPAHRVLGQAAQVLAPLVVLDGGHKRVDQGVSARLGALEELQPPAGPLDLSLEEKPVAGVVGPRQAIPAPDRDHALLGMLLDELQQRAQPGAVELRAADPFVLEHAEERMALLLAPALDLALLVRDGVLLAVVRAAHECHGAGGGGMGRVRATLAASHGSPPLKAALGQGRRGVGAPRRSVQQPARFSAKQQRRLRPDPRALPATRPRRTRPGHRAERPPRRGPVRPRGPPPTRGARLGPGRTRERGFLAPLPP